MCNEHEWPKLPFLGIELLKYSVHTKSTEMYPFLKIAEKAKSLHPTVLLYNVYGVEDSKSANCIERNPGDELLTSVSLILTC